MSLPTREWERGRETYKEKMKRENKEKERTMNWALIYSNVSEKKKSNISWFERNLLTK